jgi:hypothetical protein
MSLVDRLRASLRGWPLCEEAADEIEWLNQECQASMAEIARERARADKAEADNEAEAAMFGILTAEKDGEIERLRAAYENCATRLRNALDLLSDGPGGPQRLTAIKVLEAALEQKP